MSHRTLKLIGTILLASLPGSAAPAQDVYWIESYTGAIKCARHGGASISTVVTGRPGAADLAVNPTTGTLYFTDRATREICEVQPATGEVKAILGGLDQPEAIALDLEAGSHGGHLYYSEFRLGEIHCVTLDGAYRWVVATGLGRPADLAVEPGTHALYWTELDGQCIRRVSFDGEPVETVLGQLGTPRALTIYRDEDRVNWLVFSEDGTHRILKASMDGRRVEVLHQAFAQVHGLAADSSSDQLYFAVEQAMGQIRTLSLDDLTLGILVAGLDGPRAMTVDARCVCGDADLDGDGPDVLDALVAAQMAVGSRPITRRHLETADVDESGTITILDAFRLACAAVGQPIPFSCSR